MHSNALYTTILKFFIARR